MSNEDHPDKRQFFQNLQKDLGWCFEEESRREHSVHDSNFLDGDYEF